MTTAKAFGIALSLLLFLMAIGEVTTQTFFAPF